MEFNTAGERDARRLRGSGKMRVLASPGHHWSPVQPLHLSLQDRKVNMKPQDNIPPSDKILRVCFIFLHVQDVFKREEYRSSLNSLYYLPGQLFQLLIKDQKRKYNSIRFYKRKTLYPEIVSNKNT